MENCLELLDKLWTNRRKIAVGRTLSSLRSLPHWTQEQFRKSAKFHANDIQLSSQTSANTHTCQKAKAASASIGHVFFLIIIVHVHVCLQKLRCEALIHLNIVCQSKKESVLYCSCEKAIKKPLKAQKDIKGIEQPGARERKCDMSDWQSTFLIPFGILPGKLKNHIWLK